MKSAKCSKCGLVNFEIEKVCKKCKSPLIINFQKSSLKSAKPLGELEFQSGISLMAKALMIIGSSLTILTTILALFYRESFGSDFTLMIFIVGVIPFLCCVYVAVNFFGSKKVEIYQNGLVYTQKSKKDIIFWKEIKNCCETIEWILIDGIPIGRGRVITLTTTANNKLILGQEIGNLSKIRDIIRNNLTF